MSESIEKKISKLLALSESSNPNEAKAALLKAQELMLKHNISMTHMDHKDRIVIERIDMRPQKPYIRMAAIIANNFRTKTWFGRNHISFIGYADDVMASSSCLDFLVKKSSSCFSQYIYENGGEGCKSRYYGCLRVMYRHWMDGFICGLEESFEMRRSNPEYELMVVTPLEVIREYEKLDLFPSHTGSYNTVKDEAYDAGFKEGMRVIDRRSIEVAS